MKTTGHIFIVCLFFVASGAFAQSRYAGAFMELGVGARPLALGSAAAAMEGTGETFFYNPSSLGLLKKAHANLMYAPTFGSLSAPMASFNYIGGAVPLRGGGTIALNWTRFSVDEIPLYPELDGSSFSERNKNLSLRPDGAALGYIEDVEDAFYFSFAKTLESILPLGWWYGDLPITIPFGVNFKLLRQKLGDATASGMGVDLGLLIKFNFGTLVHERRLGDLTFALSALDVTQTSLMWSTKNEDRIQRTLMFGLAYSQPLGFANAVVNAYYTFYEKYDQHHLGGIEFAIKGAAVRLGMNDAGLTAGAGIQWRKFSVDYGFVTNPYQDVHRLSCSIAI